MRSLGAPAVVAALAALLAVLVHPALQADAWLPSATVAIPALALLLVLALALRPAPVAALGALALVLALGYDAVRGHVGTLTLAPGQGTRTFEEEGPGGKRLGYRPLGFELLLESVASDGAVDLATSAGRLHLTPQRAAEAGGFRFGAPRTVATGQAALLRLSVSGPGGTRQVDLVPGETASADGLAIALERYFPDFALDQKNEPYSRSNEPRNPAALLEVRRPLSGAGGNQAWRVFVIRAMPGVHQQQGLDASFALVSVEPALSVTVNVTGQPAAPLVGGALLVLALGLARRP